MIAGESFRIISLSRRIVARFGKITLLEKFYKLKKKTKKDSILANVKYEKISIIKSPIEDRDEHS